MNHYISTDTITVLVAIIIVGLFWITWGDQYESNKRIEILEQKVETLQENMNEQMYCHRF